MSETNVEEVSPMSADDFLEHHGVMGMKWGVHRSAKSASAAAARTARVKPTTTDIHNARVKTNSRVRALQTQADKVNLSTGKTQAREMKKLDSMSVDFLKSPDRATALRLTKGEKAAAAILAVALPGPGTAGVAVGVGVRVAGRKAVEKQIRDAQAGKYGK